MNANRTSGCEHPCKSAGRMFLNFPVNSKNIRAGSRCRAILQKNSIWKEMPQESTSSFLFLWITPLNTLRRVEKSTFSGEKTAKKQNFRCRIPAIPCRKVISTASLTASTVRMRRGPGESGGYGIGLSVAAAIVKAHKGKITAERTRDGICFKAVFPAKG